MMRQCVVLCIFFALVVSVYAEEEETEVVRYKDKCADVKCSTGEICMDGECACMNTCDDQWNHADRWICVDNYDYRHECDLWRNMCYCRRDDERCGSEEFKGHRPNDDVVIRYHSRCQDFDKICNWDLQQSSFAERFATWFRRLFDAKWASSDNWEDDSLLRPMTSKARSSAGNVLKISPNGNSVSKELLSYWFCEIDRDNDGKLDKRELTRLTRMLLPAEPCITVFFTTCSTSDSISGDDWLKCFGVDSSVNCADYQ